MRLIDHLTARRHSRQSVLVEHGHLRASPQIRRRLAARLTLMFFLLTIWVLHRMLDWNGPVWDVLEPVATVIAGYIIIKWATNQFYEAKSYRDGWLDGRYDMVETMTDHDNCSDWLTSCMTHDGVHVLGMPVEVPDLPPWIEEEES